MFPADNAWNQDISQTPLHPNSAAIISTIQSNGGDRLHPDFGENPDYGIPFVVVPGSQPLVPITYTAYGDESDPGPFPVPLDAPVEGGAGSTGDRHVLVLRAEHVRPVRAVPRVPLRRRAGGPTAAPASTCASNALRPLGWTSADAAGLPILPGLVRYDEVAAGEIRHAIRVTFSADPARLHPAGDALRLVERHRSNLPPMGTAAAAEGLVRHVAADRPGPRDRRRDAALRVDRRRQRVELVLPGRAERGLERRRPQPAEGGLGIELRGRRHRAGAHRGA